VSAVSHDMAVAFALLTFEMVAELLVFVCESFSLGASGGISSSRLRLRGLEPEFVAKGAAGFW